MTEQEYLQRIKDLEDQLNVEKQNTTKLTENQSKQNSYITKLEEKANKQEQSNTPAQQVALDPNVTKYLARKMREDTIADAMNTIRTSVSQEEIVVLEPDLMKFLNETMNSSNTSVAYITDAFNLIYGRAMRNKTHAIHQANKTSQQSPTQQQIVQNANQLVRQTPPVMSNRDTSAVQTPPATPGSNPISSTRDAFDRFKNKLSFQGENKFV